MVPGTGVPALPSWLSSLVLFPLLHPELHFSPLMFALGGPNSQCSALEKVTWSSECNHFFFSSTNYVFFTFISSIFFFVLCFDIAYIVVTALHLFFLNPYMLGNFKIMPCKWFWETTLVLQLKCNYFSAVFQKYLSEANLIFISSTLLHN